MSRYPYKVVPKGGRFEKREIYLGNIRDLEKQHIKFFRLKRTIFFFFFMFDGIRKKNKKLEWSRYHD